MGRLPGFDYKRPFFYMVTLKRLPQTRQPAKPGIAPARVFGRDSGASAGMRKCLVSSILLFIAHRLSSKAFTTFIIAQVGWKFKHFRVFEQKL